ncbi:MAG: LysR family transcriptional regulator [Lautropia sp.]
MELRQLRYFVCVAQLRSFTMAAKSLAIAQPALSRQVQSLERELGTPLFQRHSRGISLTSAGELLLQRARSILAEVENTKAAIGDSGAQLSGNHTLGMPIPVMPLLAEHLFLTCPSRHPGISLNLIEGFSALLPQWLLGGSIDLAILYAAGHPEISVTPLLTEQLYVVGANSGRHAAVADYSLRDLANLPLIMPPRPHPMWDTLDAHGVHPRTHLDAGALGIMRQLALDGKGFVMFPLSTLHRDIASGALAAKPIKGPSLTRIVSLCHSRARPPTASLLAMHRFVHREVQDLVNAGGWPGASLLQSQGVQPG